MNLQRFSSPYVAQKPKLKRKCNFFSYRANKKRPFTMVGSSRLGRTLYKEQFVCFYRYNTQKMSVNYVTKIKISHAFHNFVPFDTSSFPLNEIRCLIMNSHICRCIFFCSFLIEKTRPNWSTHTNTKTIKWVTRTLSLGSPSSCVSAVNTQVNNLC